MSGKTTIPKNQFKIKYLRKVDGHKELRDLVGQISCHDLGVIVLY